MTGNRFSTKAGIAFVLVVGSALASLPASAATTLTVGKAAATAETLIPVNVGDELGIFQKHGLDLKIVDFTGGSKMDQAMAAGSLDISAGDGTEMAFIAKGLPMKAVCMTAGPPSFLGIGVPADSPITSVDQLKGKKIGISSAGSFTEWLARELARNKGWGPDGVTPVAIGNGVTSVSAAFRQHQVDADIGGVSNFLNMQEQNIGRLLAPVSSYEGSIASGALSASDHLIQTDPDAIRSFLAAWLETIRYIRAHKAETVKIEARLNQTPESVVSKVYDLTIGMFSDDCKFDPQALATLQRGFVELKFLDTPPDMSKLYTEAFVPR
jgi:ABC-type nitrate/sulfonate/bicarbonate transport system substrate-binding protein